MSRWKSGGRPPARDKTNQAEALEVQIEWAWGRLQRLAPGGRRTLCLSPATGCLALRTARTDPQAPSYPGEIGTFTRAIGLADLREIVFHEFGGKR